MMDTHPVEEQISVTYPDTYTWLSYVFIYHVRSHIILVVYFSNRESL